MVKLKINNKDFEAGEGLTVLDVATEAGFDIPTLCNNKKLPHYSSCMVCMVKDNRSNSFIPSCSALVQEGMDIDTSGEDVILLRQKAIELILLEHRAECEAPCRVVCPAGYNIPLMNRYLAEKDFENALKLSVSELNTSQIMCTDCPGYCENACRRKKIDQPVSIRNLQLFVFQSINKDKSINASDIELTTNEPVQGARQKKVKTSGRFSSHTGKIEQSELLEWLKECGGAGIRVREISETEKAALEAENCMHCDCRAADDCRLRDLAGKLSVKDPRGKLVNSPIEKKINHNTGLVFENTKCIKCGLCVRLCEGYGDEPALCFVNRGFITILSEPLTEQFDNILKNRSKDVIEICPTGALSQLK